MYIDFIDFIFITFGIVTLTTTGISLLGGNNG